MNGIPVDDVEFDRRYNAVLPGLEIGQNRVMDLVREVLSATEQRGLARAKIIDEPRIKGMDSLRRKARLRGWGAADALLSCDDMIGVRVVCNNLSDLSRFVDLLQRRLAEERDEFLGPDVPIEVAIEDHVTDAKPDGYRAVHVKFRLRVPDGTRFGAALVGCEVQVRTLLQDGWARLSHHDMYKTEDLPADLKERFTDLSRILKAADEMAQGIRDRITSLRAAPDMRPELNRVTRDGIAYLFASAYGRNPPDYVIDVLLGRLAELGIESLEEFERFLGDDKLRKRMERSYRTAFPFGGGISPEDHFLLVPFAVARGAAGAVREARRRGKDDRAEIEAQGRDEVTDQLPGTAEEFLEELEAGKIDLDGAAASFGAKTDCAVCGEDIIDPEAFEEGASSHYGGHDFDGRVSSYLYGCGVETGGFENSSLCSYHDDVMHRDD